MSFNNVAIASVKENDYRNHFWCISKNEAIKIMKNSDLSKKKWVIMKILKKFFIYVKDE